MRPGFKTRPAPAIILPTHILGVLPFSYTPARYFLPSVTASMSGMLLMAEPPSRWFCAADYPDSDTSENLTAVSKALEKI